MQKLPEFVFWMFLYLYFSKKKADNLVFFSPSVTVCIFHATQISLKNDLLFSFGKLWQQQQYYYYYCVGSASLVHNCKTVLKLISFKNVFVSRLHKQALASFIFLYSLKLWTFARFIWKLLLQFGVEPNANLKTFYINNLRL